MVVITAHLLSVSKATITLKPLLSWKLAKADWASFVDEANIVVLIGEFLGTVLLCSSIL